MTGKAPPDRNELTRTEDGGATLDLPDGVGGIAPGQVLGERYQVLSLLGRGGMGEVWHAFDLKLRVEVALKALREDLFKSERRLEMLRDEVRAAREVVSPNVCRIFDLIEIEGRELVSMEYVDGATLLGVLQERGPLELKEAQDIASQFLAGLEAIHKAGLIHRDIKPENIMLTRAGRVVVMDFGLARQETEGGGSVSGTPAYMAPEQAAGQTLDARADVYAAGVVLAEMVSPDGLKDLTSRQSVWEAVRSEPAQVPESPWAPVIQRAVRKDREQRFNSAHTLTRALEDVTLRVEGAEDLHPYPGLASFTEADAEYFFGREAEVEQMWRKLEGPPRMLGLVGPSGAGKTSFLRAGLIPAAPSNWAVVRCSPGTRPLSALREALVSEMSGDTEAMKALVRSEDPSATASAAARWREHADHALLIVDQFEELVTLNAEEDQVQFASLLHDLVLQADIAVLLSLRDDFLMACHRHETLRPIVTDLTLLQSPTGAALRRALTQPALQCGYRFEDDELVDEMLAEVEGERGALPLLAFAAARLWEKRDRDSGLLTRQAYHDIGGVGGALARHAEATIDRIGHERLPIVRELFRNLVTAEGTRAVREWDELLSVFERDQGRRAGMNHAPTSGKSSRVTTVGEGFIPSRDVAEDVLGQLIDARLLTSYEVREGDDQPTRRVEIIHESLLANWPRLVRWQTQDADAAQLRDQLRQAAKTWDEHGRTTDYLWSGKAYREFSVWWEGYPGGLSELEEAFATAMTSQATWRKRRRRVAATAAIVLALVVAAVFGALWRRSRLETSRAEAAGLLSEAQLQLETNPSAALAYATTSIQLSDTADSRQLALKILWSGPTALVVNEERSWEIEFSADGKHLIQAMDEPPYRLRAIRSDGIIEPLQDVHDGWVDIAMSTTSNFFATLPWGNNESWGLWSIGHRKPLTLLNPPDSPDPMDVAFDPDRQRAVLLVKEADEISVTSLTFKGRYERLGVIPFKVRKTEGGNFSTYAALEPSNGKWAAILNDRELYLIDIDEKSLGLPRRLVPRRLEHIEGAVKAGGFVVDPTGRFIVARHEDGYIRLWDFDGTDPPTEIQEPPGVTSLRMTPDGSMLEAVKRDEGQIVTWVWSLKGDEPKLLRQNDLGTSGGFAGWTINPAGQQVISVLNPDSNIRMWPLSAPADAAPVIMKRGDGNRARRVRTHSNGMWLASSFTNGLTLWPVNRSYPIVIDRYDDWMVEVAFGPGGEWIATSSVDASGTVRMWELDGGSAPAASVIGEIGPYAYGLTASPDGKGLLVGSHLRGAQLVSLEGQPPRQMPGDEEYAGSTAISRDGRFGAAATVANGTSQHIRIWDMNSKETLSVIDLPYSMAEATFIEFTDDGHLLSGTKDGLLAFNIETLGRETLVGDCVVGKLTVNDEKSIVLFVRSKSDFEAGAISPLGEADILELHTGTVRLLATHGDRVTAVALDATGEILVTGDADGVIRVGSVTGEEPHLLLGSPGEIFDVAVDPKGRWIASLAGSELRLWPMPDLSKPPLHTLPHEELIAKLKTLTNLRVVRDPESATGWKLTHDPFPGWETVPTW